mgnify:CR=1 FL=1
MRRSILISVVLVDGRFIRVLWKDPVDHVRRIKALQCIFSVFGLAIRAHPLVIDYCGAHVAEQTRVVPDLSAARCSHPIRRAIGCGKHGAQTELALMTRGFSAAAHMRAEKRAAIHARLFNLDSASRAARSDHLEKKLQV